jgi:hypothetical protein
MSSSIRLGATMIALATLLAACGSTIDQSPGVTDTPTATAMPTATNAPTPTLTPGPPSAPTNFTITLVPGQPCPIAVPTTQSNTCNEFDFSWQSAEGPDVWFRIFAGNTGEGDLTCSDVQASGEYQPLLDTAPGARDAQWFQNGMATGGGTYCYWLVAVNPQGSSAMVLGSGWQ